MLVKFMVETETCGRDFDAYVDEQDLADCTTLEGAQHTIAAAIQDAFEVLVGWSSAAMSDDQARKLWEAAKAAQEENNAGK